MARAPAPVKGGSEGGGALYYEIAGFQIGIDVRKSPLTAPPGSLRMLQNAHITPGGEIEKRSAFVYWCTAPAGSLGLCSVNAEIYTHLPDGGGGTITPPTDTAIGVIHITAPAGVTLIKQLDFDVFDGSIFAVMQDAPGDTYCYFNGVYVPDADNRCTTCRTYKGKMYGVWGRLLSFSANGDPTVWTPAATGDPANGAGSVPLNANDGDAEALMGMEVYYDKLAIFSTESCQLWFLDPDPNLNQYYQTLRDAGTLAPNSVRQYVANDVYFLGTHGIRSLRARDLTTTAAVADVGSPLDPMIQQLIADRTANGVYWTQAILSPRTGRIWMVLPDQIFVLSNFASPNISAWSLYIPEFTIDINGVCAADPFVALRATDGKIYRFGSGGTLTYDSCPVQFITPFLGFDKPASFKFYQGFDAICTSDTAGGWTIQMSFDPTATPAPYDTICTIDGPTLMDGRIPISGRSTNIQIRATHAAPGAATFSKIFIHYAGAETD
jgi:hypothetical protein